MNPWKTREIWIRLWLTVELLRLSWRLEMLPPLPRPLFLTASSLTFSMTKVPLFPPIFLLTDYPLNTRVNVILYLIIIIPFCFHNLQFQTRVITILHQFRLVSVFKSHYLNLLLFVPFSFWFQLIIMSCST